MRLRPLPDIAGFTLLEAVVVVSILTIVMVVAIPAYRGAESRQILKNAAQLLVMDLKAQRQRANSLSARCWVTIQAGGYETFENSAPDGAVPPPVPVRTKTGVDFQRLLNRPVTITSPPAGTQVVYAPIAGGGNITQTTITLRLGGDTRFVDLQGSGEVIIR